MAANTARALPGPAQEADAQQASAKMGSLSSEPRPGAMMVALQHPEKAEASVEDGIAWVTLRMPCGNRATIFLHTYQQACAIADAINSEVEARQ